MQDFSNCRRFTPFCTTPNNFDGKIWQNLTNITLFVNMGQHLPDFVKSWIIICQNFVNIRQIGQIWKNHCQTFIFLLNLANHFTIFCQGKSNEYYFSKTIAFTPYLQLRQPGAPQPWTQPGALSSRPGAWRSRRSCSWPPRRWRLPCRYDAWADCT